MVLGISLSGGVGSLLRYGLLILSIYVAYQLVWAVKRNTAIRKLGGQRAYILTNNPLTGKCLV
jgi:hypothetical protein